MSSNPKLWGHGPFKFVFKQRRSWYHEFQPCSYDLGYKGLVDFTHKHPDFKDEQEWWTQYNVYFELKDIDRIEFMVDSPGARIFPRKTPRIWKKLLLVCPKGIRLVIDPNHYPPKGD